MNKYCDGCVHYEVCEYSYDLTSWECEHRRPYYQADAPVNLTLDAKIKLCGMAFEVKGIDMTIEGVQEIRLKRDELTEHQDRELWNDIHVREKD